MCPGEERIYVYEISPIHKQAVFRFKVPEPRFPERPLHFAQTFFRELSSTGKRKKRLAFSSTPIGLIGGHIQSFAVGQRSCFLTLVIDSMTLGGEIHLNFYISF